MSRRSSRVTVALTVSLRSLMGGAVVTCRTLDISHDGINLDTVAVLDEGQRVSVTVMTEHGPAFELGGQVVRAARGKRPSLGIKLQSPPVEWRHFVESKSDAPAAIAGKASRRHILVVGSEKRQRVAMAIYLSSGCDVVFVATNDLDDVRGALVESRYDAVVVEAEATATDAAWTAVLALAKQIQPETHRIVRLIGAVPKNVPRGLVHRFVDRDAGLAALLDAFEH